MPGNISNRGMVMCNTFKQHIKAHASCLCIPTNIYSNIQEFSVSCHMIDTKGMAFPYKISCHVCSDLMRLPNIVLSW